MTQGSTTTILAFLLLLAPTPAQTPDAVTALLNQGETLVHDGQLVQAQDFFEKGLLRFPGNPDLAFDLGMVFFLQRSWPRAIENFEKSLVAKPNQVDPLFYLAQAYRQSSDLTLAREAIARAAALAPDNPDVCQEYGEYLAAGSDKRTEGLRWLEKARSLNPDLERIDFDIGLAQFNLNDFSNLNDMKGAIVSFQAALKKDPTNGEAAFLLAESWSALGDWEKARDSYNYALSHGYASGPAYYGLGTALVQLGDYGSAVAPLEKALVLDPSLYKAHFQLDKAFRNLGRLEEARHESRLFEILYRSRNGTDTYAQFQAATQTPAWAHVKALLEENKEQEALDYVAKPLRQGQSDARSLEPNPHYQLGVVYNTMGRIEEAKRELELARAQTRASAPITAYLGMVQLSAGEVGQAETSYNSALTLDPANELAIIGLARIRHQQQRWADVIAYLERSGTANPGALYLLCDAYFRAGKTKEGNLMAEAIRSLAPADKNLLDDLDQLVKVHRADQSVPTTK